MGPSPSVVLLAVILGYAAGQENAGPNIASALLECYKEGAHREARLPSTINILIDLIRRVEDGKSVQDARSFAIELIHRFRQDGIRKVDVASPTALPFSPKDFQMFKNRILLNKFIPGNANNFPNETLTTIEKCSLHFMLSNTFERRARGDESRVCNTLGRYTKRIKRELEVETFKQAKGKNGKIEVVSNPEKDVEPIHPAASGRGYVPDSSDCPVESGVIYTKWGAVQAGTVLAGIAAAFEPQNVQINGVEVNSKFAVSLAGDLAEVALRQGFGSNTFNVGLGGGWNSTTVPRWYFVKSPVREFTDAEIRADLDALILSENVQSWKNRFSNLKVSQILDLYYSPRGSFTKGVRACKRNELSTQYAPKEMLTPQTLAFAYIYNNEATFDGTPVGTAIKDNVDKSITNFFNYYTSLKDISCEADENIGRVATDLIIVLDTAWPYNVIQSALYYLLENLDVNKYESQYTIVNAKDGELILNTTHYLSDFHELYNISVHEKLTSGFNLEQTMPVIEKMIQKIMDSEKSASKGGGKSLTVLFVPYERTVSAEFASYFENRQDSIFSLYMPDVKFLALGSGSKDAYNSIVSNSDDSFSLAESTSDNSIVGSVKPLIERIRELPRRIINPRCGSSMSGDLSTNTIELYVEPGTINYYKISPNYFHGEGDHMVKIRGQWDSITVCTSRSESKPSQAVGGMACRNMTTNEETYELSNTCTDSLDSCNPFYFSVQAPAMNNSNARCSDAGCRFPDNVKFTVTTEGFLCANGSTQLASSFLLLAFMLYILRL